MHVINLPYPLSLHRSKEEDMESRSLSVIALLLGFVMVSNSITCASATCKCNFPAIYNFGDSNSDTGARSAAVMEVAPPYGVTFFKKPAKRLSDGRVILDFMAEKLGLPYLSAYLDAIGTNFRHGANFAAAGAAILPGPFSPFDLNVQLSQFSQFKLRSTDLFHNLSGSSFRYMLPNPGDFSKSLYTVDIGQNDLASAFRNMTPPQIVAEFPGILDRFAKAIERLYGEGARAFWIHNTGPLGCLPIMALPFKSRNGALDKNGCAPLINQVAQAFNTQLKSRVDQLRTHYPLARLVYVDMYSAKFDLISDANNQGFVSPLKYCCGKFSPVMVMCGTSVLVNGTAVAGTACKDPQKHINWDAIHYTEAANRWVSSRVLDGSYSDPRVPISCACP